MSLQAKEAPGNSPIRAITIADYRAEMFEALTGESMVLIPVMDGPSAATLELVEVRRGAVSPYFERQQFSLLFFLKDQPPLADCLYTIDLPGFAPEGILISRVFAPKYRRLDPDAMIYEAVFT